MPGFPTVSRLAPACVLVLGAALSATACRGIEPPYAPTAAPEVDQLMDVTVAGLSAIQVPRAKVRQGKGPAANLMLVAQAPGRFAGTIQIAGNELVSLAVNEGAYGLRWVGGREGTSLPPGYYSGPPSRCAVETLLGIGLEPEAFVDLILGGAPLIPGPHTVGDRSWDRKAGRELLTIANGRHQQQLRFAWFEGQWVFAGASLWLLDGAGEPTWLWTIRHDELHEVGGKVVPKKTVIRQPKYRKGEAKGSQTLTVTFQKQIPNPKLGEAMGEDSPPDGGDEGGKGESGGDGGNQGDSWDDDWGEGDEGEGDEGEGDEGEGDESDGWENADGTEGAAPETAPETARKAPPANTQKPPAPSAAPIPPQFVGNPTGLRDRGDLCAGR